MGDEPTPPNGTVPSRSRVEPGSVNIPLGEYPATTATRSSVYAKTISEEVIYTLNSALSQRDYITLASVFLPDNSYWRDHLALTWDLHTVKGPGNIAEYVKASSTPITRVEIDSSSGFREPDFKPIDAWGDVTGIQFFITFETKVGRGRGVVSLAWQEAEWHIFTISTVLTELKGFEEPTGKKRTRGVEHGGNPERKNWRETREADTEFEGSEPRVLIIGMRLLLRS